LEVSNSSDNAFLVNGGGAKILSSYNWNFPDMQIVRNTSNSNSAKMLSFLLNGDSDSDTTNGTWNILMDAAATITSSSASTSSTNLRFIGPGNLILNPAGNVGIGTTSPAVALDVNGGIRPGSSGVTTGGACTGEGTFGYDSSAHAPVYCNSSGVWASMSGATGFSHEILITSGTSWTVPTGVVTAKVTAIGGGGSGGCGVGAGAGGGAGGVAQAVITGLTPGGSISISIAAAGASQSTVSANGLNGGTTTFGPANGVTLTAHGGSGGSYDGNTAASSGGAGGSASGGTINISGQNGAGGEAYYYNGGGAGGSTYGGYGIGGATITSNVSTTTTGSTGLGFGGGGGGGLWSGASGAGANGSIVIEY
jgi:hypothetical protein